MLEPDARTTSPKHRALVLVVLVGAFVYFGACYVAVWGTSLPVWAYPGQWSMFTKKETWHHDVVATAHYGVGREKVNLQALFPSTWDSGPRYIRGAFRNDPAKVRVLAHSVCQRMTPMPDSVSISETRWRARIGVSADRRREEQQRPLTEHACSEKVNLPAGMPL